MEIIDRINQLPWHPTRRWSTRGLGAIRKIIVHQELGNGSIEQVNDYHISPGNHISENGCPHFSYHYGVRKSGSDGEIIQVNALNNIVWHTKGQNTASVGIMLEGFFKGPGQDLGDDGPTKSQLDSLQFLVGYLTKTLGLSNQDVYGHYHFGKPACPGTRAAEWIEHFRNGEDADIKSAVADLTIEQIQERLNKLGYECGAVDGIVGIKTLAAIRKFQKDFNLTVDGVIGPQTRYRLFVETEEV